MPIPEWLWRFDPGIFHFLKRGIRFLQDFISRRSLSNNVFQIVLQHPRLSGQYQLVVDREGPLDTLCVRTELNNASAQVAPVEIEQIVHWLQHRIKTLVGVSTRIDVLRPDSIERTLTGKARRVVDQRKR